MSLLPLPYPAAARDLALEYQGPRWTAPHEVQALCHWARHTTGSLMEIGCNEGRTLRELALACPGRSCFGVDYSGDDGGMCPEQRHERPPPGRLGLYARSLTTVTILDVRSQDLGAALAAAPCLSSAALGFIFIDGNHTLAGVRTDSEMAFRYFAERGTPGLIAWHDCYDAGPAWVGVRAYLESRPEAIFRIEGTCLAYLRVG